MVDGKTGALMFTSLINDDYRLMIFMPTEEFLMIRDQFRNYFIIVILMVVVISIAHVLISLKYIYKPMNNLLADLSLVNVKESKSYRMPVKEKDIFIELRQKLNQNLEETENYFKDSIANADELYIENQRFKLLIDSTQDFILQIDDTHHIVFASGKGLIKLIIQRSP